MRCVMGIRKTTLVCVTLGLLSASTAFAQTGGGYDLTWSTIDGGGAMSSTGGTFDLSGTIAQPDA